MIEPIVNSKTKAPLNRVALVGIIFFATAFLGGVFYVVAVMIALKAHAKDDCQLQLGKSIGVLCREYAAQHEGHFPSKWEELKAMDIGSGWARVFICPSTGHQVGSWEQVNQWADYRLISGCSTNDSPDKILAIEPLSNHETGANVLFVDGSTRWWPAKRVLAHTPALKSD